ncbi:hypothetical protein A3C57_03010 [Candidatus Nomurabacteria bacterium RIFCSPHIGHO2_02_FULL_33_12]|nr:MAG: hypothetical protein A3C57_03010 [Candidatus Nomurabacteria bacterium RIFCSPHIGHO2_02_FULL_33_12]
MKTFEYKGLLNTTGEKQNGRVESVSRDSAIETLQQRGIVITSIEDIETFNNSSIMSLLNRVPVKEVVFMARQMATLFEAHVSAHKAFSLITDQAENPTLKMQLHNITADLSAGNTISQAIARYPDTFSSFFINMVRSGEESGKLSETFVFLADYMERQYELARKTKSALIYPAFVIFVFFSVMILMFRFIIPKIGEMITQSGNAIPIYTQIVLSISGFFVDYGLYLLIVGIIIIIAIVIYLRSDIGKFWLDKVKITAPVAKNLYNKLYLARIADNLDTMLSSGIPIIRTLEITSAVVGNRIYQSIVKEVSDEVRAGVSLSNAFAKHKEIPAMLSQMIRVGEETGMLGQVLKTLGRFYRREVDQAVDTIVALIEPIMIIVLGVGVGVLLVSVLMPIYNMTTGLQ